MADIRISTVDEPILLKMSNEGPTGSSIVSFKKIASQGRVDTYQGEMSDGYKFTVDVTNGYTPSFVIGTVTTLSADEDVTVEANEDTETGIVTLNFGIPRGHDGSGTWGSIPGYIEDQTDLQDALDGKSDAGHNHDERYYTETEIDGKLGAIASTLGTIASANYTVSNIDLTEGVSELPSGDLYFYYE